jgi:hypothetical protein
LAPDTRRKFKVKETTVRHLEVGTVQEIENLPPELQAYVVIEFDLFLNRRIEIGIARRTHNVAWRVAKGECRLQCEAAARRRS